MNGPDQLNPAGAPCARASDMSNNVLLCRKEFLTFIDAPVVNAIMQLPLPGIVIFVHGVNSDGEWYAAAEQGLCAGLNDRLKRRNEHMAHPRPEGGQLTPVRYLPELTPDGYINPDLKFDTFIQERDHFSPVVHFRWGYRANSLDLQKFGDSIDLNERGYWGGGPFANGCTSLPDMWGEGLSDNLFLWMQVQHLNPVAGRLVYNCPHRAYFVLAALRLAKLIESIRKKQADVPITVVCHSQGNMIGMAAAFLGDRLDAVSDAAGTVGRCVADNYVLTNPPYSLVNSNFTENWMLSKMTDSQGRTGRQTSEARRQTMRAFFDIIRKPAARQQEVAYIDSFTANKAHGFDTASDRAKYGYGATPGTCCRVTLYSNPHDQVISSTTVQGIGWRGMSGEEIQATGGGGIFCQRVFAQGFQVGVKGQYHHWKNHCRKPEPGSQGYWYPESPKAKYSVSQGLDAQRNFLGKVLTVGLSPVMVLATGMAGSRINAVPDKNWANPLQAPDLPEPFEPQSLRFGKSSTQFDEGYDAPGEQRDKERVRDANDPYQGDRPIETGKAQCSREADDAAKGDVHSEARLRYEDHARLRMQAKREGLAKKEEMTTQEDKLSEASDAYKEWRSKQIKTSLANSIDAQATDHSTIMTNGLHAQKALAYDVAVGVCHVSESDLRELRVAADWRFLEGLGKGHPSQKFFEYFENGLFMDVTVSAWSKRKNSEGSMPEKIVDQRENAATKTRTPQGDES